MIGFSLYPGTSSDESGGSCRSCSGGDSRNLLIASSIEECCRIGFGKVPMVSQEVDCFTRYVSYTPKIIPLSKACFYLIKISVLSE